MTARSLDVCDTLRVRGNVLRAGAATLSQPVLLEPQSRGVRRAGGRARARSVPIIPSAASAGMVTSSGLLQLDAPLGSGVVFSASGVLVVSTGTSTGPRVPDLVTLPSVTVNGLLLTQRAAADVVFYVAPWGADPAVANGTVLAPYASLADVQDAIAAADLPAGARVTVALLPGRYTEAVTWSTPRVSLVCTTPPAVPFGIAVADAPAVATALGCAVFTDDFTVTVSGCTLVNCAFLKYFNGSLETTGATHLVGCYFYRPSVSDDVYGEAIKLEHTVAGAGATFADCVVVCARTSGVVFKARGELVMTNCSVSAACTGGAAMVQMQPWVPEGGPVVPMQADFRDCLFWNTGDTEALGWSTGDTLDTAVPQALSVFGCEFRTVASALFVQCNAFSAPAAGSLTVLLVDIVTRSGDLEVVSAVVFELAPGDNTLIPAVQLGEWQCAPGSSNVFYKDGDRMVVDTYRAIVVS